MSLLSADDLAYMRATQQEAMPGTVIIERYTLTNNGMGGAYETWTAAGTVDGRVYPRTRLGQGETVNGSQVMSVSEWFATLPTGTVVTAKDRLVCDGRSWEIMRVNNDEMYQTCVRCELRAFNEERRV